jgi:hypothetical protein
MDRGQSSTKVMDREHGTLRGAASGAGRFVIHFAEMWIAMMIGMWVFHAVVIPVLVLFGFTQVLDGTSVVHQLGMGVFMAAPMVAWMRVAGCGWRDGLEMAAAMLLPFLAVFELCRLGVSEALPWLNGFGGTAMMLGMLADMLYRWKHYTGDIALVPWRRARSELRP